jgi:hypothetical protein
VPSRRNATLCVEHFALDLARARRRAADATGVHHAPPRDAVHIREHAQRIPYGPRATICPQSARDLPNGHFPGGWSQPAHRPGRSSSRRPRASSPHRIAPALLTRRQRGATPQNRATMDVTPGACTASASSTADKSAPRSAARSLLSLARRSSGGATRHGRVEPRERLLRPGQPGGEIDHTRPPFAGRKAHLPAIMRRLRPAHRELPAGHARAHGSRARCSA